MAGVWTLFLEPQDSTEVSEQRSDPQIPCAVQAARSRTEAGSPGQGSSNDDGWGWADIG